MSVFTFERRNSETGLELSREPRRATSTGPHLARLAFTLDGEPLSAVTLSAEDLRLLANRAFIMARELDQANEVPR